MLYIFLSYSISSDLVSMNSWCFSEEALTGDKERFKLAGGFSRSRLVLILVKSSVSRFLNYNLLLFNDFIWGSYNSGSESKFIKPSMRIPLRAWFVPIGVIGVYSICCSISSLMSIYYEQSLRGNILRQRKVSRLHVSGESHCIPSFWSVTKLPISFAWLGGCWDVNVSAYAVTASLF